jgi:hypothetical protein
VKALSLWQPWASAIAVGAKCIETRHWKTDYRGPLLIHAAKRQLTREDWDFIDLTVWWQVANYPEKSQHREDNYRASQWIKKLPLGAIVAVARLVDCRPITMRNGVGTLCRPGHSQDVSEMETALGNFTPGRFGWVLSNVRALPQPIPFKGAQGLFYVPDELIPEEYRNTRQEVEGA